MITTPVSSSLNVRFSISNMWLFTFCSCRVLYLYFVGTSCKLFVSSYGRRQGRVVVSICYKPRNVDGCPWLAPRRFLSHQIRTDQLDWQLRMAAYPLIPSFTLADFTSPTNLQNSNSNEEMAMGETEAGHPVLANIDKSKVEEWLCVSSNSMSWWSVWMCLSRFLSYRADTARDAVAHLTPKPSWWQLGRTVCPCLQRWRGQEADEFFITTSFHSHTGSLFFYLSPLSYKYGIEISFL